MITYTFSDSLYSDLHKDAYGFRPSGDSYKVWTNMTADEKQVLWDKMCKMVDVSIDEDARRKEESVKHFEKKISEMLDSGAADKHTAIRWFVQSMQNTKFDLMYGGERICYLLDLPYEMSSIFDDVCKELLDNME